MAQAAAKQDTFLWEGKDNKGQTVKGEVTGQSIALVKANLRRQGINPKKVKKKPKPLFGGGGKVKAADISIFSRQLATMMSSGVPLVQAFDIIGRGHENPAMQKLLLGVKADIESGSNLSEALAKHPYHFDDLFCNLVRAGEHAGILDDILDKIALYKEKTEAIKGKIKKAMFYPTAVIVVAFLITAILMLFVIPEFENLFSGFGADLPALTKFVVNMSEIFQQYWWAIFGGIIGGVYALIQAKKRSKKFNVFLDKVLIKMPILGPILNKAAIARYARTLATMFAAGVPLVEAMESVAGAVGNVVYGNAVLRMRDEVATGTQLNVAMKSANLFPNMVIQMTAIGEEAGSMDTMLSKVADFYEEEVDNAVDSLSSLLEPIIMVFLGVLIGGLVIAMYLPIFQMGKVVGG
ncbi:type II secretion system F family protein [Thiohalophilus sp.]|uniref:type II secretion system F family protein n=1 Tax=Thiohalophilus sp. TaxID=3028392 RepID=UPI002ACD463A|nr:type II secretion system F family protein [Thiohalophilus sp.]MDZ7662333.1 type II secretion system F family protein [Thiohalophilus sp.]MDZ7802416.1 type II secretion system F family protein [Thiohalophilus sp.]